MPANPHAPLEYWPVMLTAGAALVAWGELRARVSGQQKQLDDKASKEVVERVEKRLDSIDGKMDRLLEGK